MAGFKELGLVLLLDSADVPEDPQLGGRMVRVIPSDGPAVEVQVTASSKQDGTVGLLFAYAKPGVIPMGARIEWDATT